MVGRLGPEIVDYQIGEDSMFKHMTNRMMALIAGIVVMSAVGHARTRNGITAQESPCTPPNCRVSNPGTPCVGQNCFITPVLPCTPPTCRVTVISDTETSAAMRTTIAGQEE